MVLQELVADGLLVAPLHAELVHEDDVVALGDGELGGVGAERHSADDEVLRAVGIGRLGGELVALIAVVVEELDHAIRGHRRHALRVGTPGKDESETRRVDEGSGQRGGRSEEKSQRSIAGAVTATREDARTRRCGRTWGRRTRVPCDSRDLLDPLVRREHRLQVTELHRAPPASLAREEEDHRRICDAHASDIAVFTRRRRPARRTTPARSTTVGSATRQRSVCGKLVGIAMSRLFARMEFRCDTFLVTLFHGYFTCESCCHINFIDAFQTASRVLLLQDFEGNTCTGGTPTSRSA